MALTQKIPSVSVPHKAAVHHCRAFAAQDTRVLRLFDAANPLVLESGETLFPVDVAYRCLGKLNLRADNAVLLCHALTGDTAAWACPTGERPGWWDGLIGSGNALDPDRHFMVCTNVLGGCYGTTGPVSEHAEDGQPWGPRFPNVTIRDMVRVQHALLQALGVTSLLAAVGGSLGGFQVLEWGASYPGFVRSLVPIATTARHRPWAVAFNELARRAITTDPVFNGGAYAAQPSQGLALARMGAMISYRHHRAYAGKFATNTSSSPHHRKGQSPVASYLRHQGDKFHQRFDANTYLRLIDAMDSHDLGRNRGGLARALGSLRQPTLWLAFDSDELYPIEEQRDDASRLPNGHFVPLRSVEGHDAFLIEFDQLRPHLDAFLKNEPGESV